MPRGWSDDAGYVPLVCQEAIGIEGCMGSHERRGDDPGRRYLPSAFRKRMSVGQEMTAGRGGPQSGPPRSIVLGLDLGKPLVEERARDAEVGGGLLLVAAASCDCFPDLLVLDLGNHVLEFALLIGLD